MSAGFGRLSVVLLAAAAVVAAVNYWPLSHELEPLLFEDDLGEKGMIALAEGETYRRTFDVSAQPISGVALFSPLARVHGGIEVRFLVNGSVVRRGERFQQTYRGEAMRLTFPMRSITLPAGTAVVLEVQRTAGDALPLQVTRGSGALTISLVHPAVLEAGTRRGVMAGLAVLLAMFVIGMLARWQWALAACLVVVVSPLVLAGLLWPAGVLGISDWDYYLTVHTRYRDSILQYHSFPFWNAYTCGGTAGLADPEFPVISPLYPLELLFGVSDGLRLAAAISVTAGGLGMLALARRLGLSVPAGLLAALTVSFSSTTLLKLVEGHIDMLAAMWIPWIFWSWITAYRDQTRGRVWPLLCGVFLALTFYQGGLHILIYLAPALLVLSLLVADKRRAFSVTWLAGWWALGLSAVKLVPVLLWVAQFPDRAYALSTYTVPWLHEIFLGRHRHGEAVIPNQGGGWHEYGAYVGPLVVALAILSLNRWRTSRVVRGIIAGTTLAVAASSLGPVLAPVLDVLPWLPRSFTSRVIVLAVFGLSLLAGIGLDEVRRWSGRRLGLVLPALLVGAVAVDLFSLAYPVAAQAFVLPDVTELLPPGPAPLAFTRETHTVTIGGVGYDRSYAAARQGYGTLSYCSVLSPPTAVVPVSDPKSEYVRVAGGSGIVTLFTWTPHWIVIRASIKEVAQVVLNMNYADGWRASGQQVLSVGGRVGVVLVPGEHVVTFRYHAPGFGVGLLLTLVTLGSAGREFHHRARSVARP